MTLLIDNYDSFSYNLYQMLGFLDPAIMVVRNDELTIEDIRTLAPSSIVISPGPGTCENAGNIIEVVKTLSPLIPILGVCLGHQAICTAFGATVGHAKKLYHGKQSDVHLDVTSPLFTDLQENEKVGRYHSLSVVPSTLKPPLICTARTDDGEIMAVRHTKYPVFGVQFHPESILTPNGEVMLRNFLTLSARQGEKQ
ncbi:MAG: aminodeoxychorismate/anthranilate synthase component II [Sphaerochaeta sp.]|jgi:anthranilate synthase component 2|uniref:anthranilate synthase component II n=1 Tax=Sphaerochaeta sp. TaxID=1972642 RepID=UPI002FC668B9